MLLQDAESTKRYEVEVQLGRTDEAHIIRTIEYWDIERKRYPQCEHTAVMLQKASRAFPVRLCALQRLFPVSRSICIRLAGEYFIIFAKVVDEIKLGLVDEDEEVQAVTDRTYWEERASRTTLGMVDEMLSAVKTLDPALELKYNKFYIGLAKNGQPSNFVIFRPKKDWLRLEPRLDRSDEVLTQSMALVWMVWTTIHDGGVTEFVWQRVTSPSTMTF